MGHDQLDPAVNTELDLKMKAPRVDAVEIQKLIDVLRRSRAWMTARQICEMLYGQTSDALERRVRSSASAAVPEVVSYPGSPGYRLWSECTVEEINHCIEAFESQGRDMLKRAVAYRIAYHRQHRGVKSATQEIQLALGS